MPDTLFLNEISPLTVSETGNSPLDTALLPSGEQATLYTNGTGGVVVEIFAPGATEARLQLTLPLPDSHHHDYYNPVFSRAPDGSLAVVYQTYTTHLVDYDYGSYEEPDQVFLNAVHLSDDGNSLSDPVELNCQEYSTGYWDGIQYFDDGGFAAISHISDYSEVSYEGSLMIELLRFSADGSALGSPVTLFEGSTYDYYDTQSLALGDGRLALISKDYTNASGQVILQIFAADGSTASAPQILSADAGTYLSLYDLHLFQAADGTIAVLLEQFSDGGTGTIRLIGSDSDGQLSAPVDLSALNAALGSYTYLREVQVFTDGSLGVLVQDDNSSQRMLYQHIAANGTALTDPVALFEADYYVGTTEISLLPDGGAVLLQTSCSEAEGQTLSAQFFATDGTPLGSQTTLINLPEGEYLYSPEIQIQADGSAIFSWNVEAYTPDTGWETGSFQTTLAPIPFRGLTEGDDIEVLSTPEAVDGLGGDDAITGSDGMDRLVGSGGDDTLTGGAGNDFLYGLSLIHI